MLLNNISSNQFHRYFMFFWGFSFSASFFRWKNLIKCFLKEDFYYRNYLSI
jgi:hypothetical protein